MKNPETQYGYCCINMTLKKERNVYIGRSMIKKTFNEKGIQYAGELAEANIRDMVEIIKWNEQQGIKMYRMSSDMFPWMSEYEFEDLPNWTTIANLLKGAGALATKYGHRLTFHPGPFDVLASASKNVVDKTIRDLNQHGQIMDYMGLPRTPFAAINIHVNTTQGGKDKAMERFCNNFWLLDPCVRQRLVVENDDKESQYTTEDLYNTIYQRIGIPITFDYHHHWCHPGELTQEEALKLAAGTWRNGVKQLVHFSSCKTIHEDASQTNKRAHADYIYEHINDYGLAIDVEIEAKAKELAVQRYVKQFLTLAYKD
jgi:UV DNA damage endonuclease